MKVLIHRGSNEIGGTCIQLSTERNTILLDLGLPLSNESKSFDVTSLKPDAVLISHPHQDHFGLIDALDPSVPVYIGELGKNLIDATRVLIGKELHANTFRHFKSWQPFVIGDFTVTPYLVDHSAADAYGFLLEAGGKRVFYSGDFRGHGRKSVIFDRIVSNPPRDIDLLFMEGTMMQRTNDDFPTEADVERKIFETIKGQENISFLISSSQNIDRIVSAYRACKRAGKTLVIDIYTAWVLEQMKHVSNNMPAMEWDLVKVYATHSQDKKLTEHPEFFGDFRKRVYKHRVLKEELQGNSSGYLFFGKMSHFRTIDRYKEEKPVNVIYSQWLGYLSSSNADYFGAEAMAAYRSDPQVNFVYAHTSGHATVEDLQRFAGALQPKMLVPVHTEFPCTFHRLFKNVKQLSDGTMLLLQEEKPEVENIEQKLRKAYCDLAGESRNLKIPADIKILKNNGLVTLKLHPGALQKNMQDNTSAFEGWILALKCLVYPDSKFSVQFQPGDRADRHYQRFLTRLWSFNSLFGTHSRQNWFELSPDSLAWLENDCQYLESRKAASLKCNTGKKGRRRDDGACASGSLTELSEADLEYMLCWDSCYQGCLKSTFELDKGRVYRQFPVGIFAGKVAEENALFPGKKACIDLVADDGDEGFWLFELKKHGNAPLGIISELLFYTTIVRDMAAGHIVSTTPTEDRDCYDPGQLKGKKTINACFLAPSFHPLLLDKSIELLNQAYGDLKLKESHPCKVQFHKAILKQASIEGVDITRC